MINLKKIKDFLTFKLQIESLKSKKGVSIIIGYVLLIVIAISLSLLVYAWLKSYLPGQIEKCPDDTALSLENYFCNKDGITLSLKNSGLFSIYGFIARIREKENGFWYELKTNDEIENYFDLDEKGLKPNKKESKTFFLNRNITEIQIQPFILGEKKEIVLCDNAIITQKVQNCEKKEYNIIRLGADKVLADVDFPSINFDYSTQMKWDITSIPEGIIIDEARLCVLVQKADTPILDNDLKIWRIKDEYWDESITINEINSQNLVNENNVVLSSLVLGEQSCFDVSLQLRESYGIRENSFTIRFEDPDYPTITAFGGVEDRVNLRVGHNEAERVVFEFNSSEVGVEFGPYIEINYS